MMLRILGFFILNILYIADVGFAVTINRDRGGTHLIFEGEDLLKAHGEEDFEEDWLKKDLTYRGDCYVQTMPIEIPFQTSVNLIVHYEAKWRAVVDEVNNLSEIELARFDLAYEKSNGRSHRESEFLIVADLGELNWHAKTMDFTYVSAATEKPKEIHFKTMTIPNASKNIRAKMCGIGPSTSIRVSKIEMRLSKFDDFMTARNFNSDDLLHCYDTSLFLSKCSLSKKNLAKSEHPVMNYKVDLEFDCEGHEVEFNLETDRSKISLHPQKGRQEITLEGKQLDLLDANPKKTLQATFNPGCVLKIYTVEKSISENQKREFEKIKQDLEDLRNNSALSAKAFSDLNNLAQIMVALKASLKLMNYQAQSEKEMRTVIQGILKGMEENASGDVWEKVLYENSLLERENKQEILKLRNALQKILTDKTPFHDISLENLLSKTQLDFLLNALENKKTFLENDKHYEYFKKLEEKAKQDLKQIWLESKDFLDWELKNEL